MAPAPTSDTFSGSLSFPADAKPLNKAMMAWFAKHEFKNPQDRLGPRIDLPYANLRGLACTAIITAEFDPLRSAGTLRVEKLKAAGVDEGFKSHTGEEHEFFGMGAVLQESRDANKLTEQNLAKAAGRAAVGQGNVRSGSAEKGSN